MGLEVVGTLGLEVPVRLEVAGTVGLDRPHAELSLLLAESQFAFDLKTRLREMHGTPKCPVQRSVSGDTEAGDTGTQSDARGCAGFS